MRGISFLLLALSGLIVQGCAVTRMSTTERTAVEQALLTQSVERAISQLELSGHEGRSFVLSENVLGQIEESSFVRDTLRRHLLSEGLVEAPTTPTAQLVVTPVVSHLAIDDDHTFFGIPAFPIIVPAVGTLDLPELALYRTDEQLGRSRIGMFARDTDSGRLIFDTGTAFSETKYKRWRVLLLISFRTTNLLKPF